MAHSTNTLGRYQIIREIARSNDIVYEAIDPSIGRRVALKELQLPPNLVGGARRERVERFYREAKAAGSLTHPNIVTIYEVGEEAGRHFIAMEFLEGQNLQETLEIRGALPAKEAVDIARQVLEALDYAHSKGIIHRDIKPANIQLLPGGRVKLTDFGIARIMHEPSITASGQIFGTPSYMSPEQIAGKEIDPRSDLFSMGVVLYEALTGQKPFTGDSVVTITYNIMNTPAPEPRGVPEGLAAIVRKALEKDPAHRFQSAREFLEALSGDWTARQNAAGTLTPPPVFFPPGGGTSPLP
ncbi:MAG: serine/threonine-protein kinase, partial [Armatimonadota bacterium]